MGSVGGGGMMVETVASMEAEASVLASGAEGVMQVL